jgi:hypothetical protein
MLWGKKGLLNLVNAASIYDYMLRKNMWLVFFLCDILGQLLTWLTYALGDVCRKGALKCG